MTKAAGRKLTQARLHNLLIYFPETGEFRWKVVRGGKRPGDLAGCKDLVRGKWYLRIRIDDELILAHRLAWLYMHGKWPEDELDHDDGDGLNNRIANLKPANRDSNNRNASRRKDNKTGVPGVQLTSSGRYAAHIRQGGRQVHLGTFDTLNDAAAAREAAKQEFLYHPDHGKEPIR